MRPIGWGILVFIASGLVWVISSFGAASQQLTGKAITAAPWVYLSCRWPSWLRSCAGGDEDREESERVSEDRQVMEKHTRMYNALRRWKRAVENLERTLLIDQLGRRGYSPRAIEEILKWYT